MAWGRSGKRNFQFSAKNHKLVLMNWKNKDKKFCCWEEIWGQFKADSDKVFFYHTIMFIFPFNALPLNVFLCSWLCVELKEEKSWRLNENIKFLFRETFRNDLALERLPTNCQSLRDCRTNLRTFIVDIPNSKSDRKTLNFFIDDYLLSGP